MDLLTEIYRHIDHTPERFAHVCRDDYVTYAELRARAGALAAYLHGTLARGAPVVVYGHKQPDLVACFLACIEAGQPYVPIDAGLPAARVEMIVRHSGAALVLAPGSAKLVADVPVLAGEAFDATIDVHAGERAPAAARLRADEVMYIMYTSGSTGTPKGVQITLANVTHFLTWARSELPIGPGQRLLDQASFSFDVSVMDVYVTLLQGGTIYSIDRAMVENPLELREILPAADVEIWVSTPSFLQMCLADRQLVDPARLPSLSCFMLAGEALEAKLVREIHTRFPGSRVYNLYGPTEATIVVTSLLVDEAVLVRYPMVPLGAARWDIKLEVVDPQGHPVPRGELGEIVIEGPCVSPGYWLAPELTARVFAGQRYRTGDAGRFDGDALMFCGRLDFQVKLFGNRIELDDVAENLTALPEVTQAVVLPILREGRCEALAAFVVLRDEVSVDELRRQLAIRVPSYMVPRDIIVRGSLPMMVSGKIDRARLAAELR